MDSWILGVVAGLSQLDLEPVSSLGGTAFQPQSMSQQYILAGDLLMFVLSADTYMRAIKDHKVWPHRGLTPSLRAPGIAERPRCEALLWGPAMFFGKGWQQTLNLKLHPAERVAASRAQTARGRSPEEPW